MSNSAGKGGANPSVYDKSASAFGQAGNLLGQARSQIMSAIPGAAQGYTPDMANGFNYNARGASTTGTTYQPRNMMAAATGTPEDISAGIGQYMNPYTQNVINRSMMDVNRMVNQQDAETAAGAANSGAFGGSRQGIVEALTRSEGQKNIGDLSARLRQQGFDTAAGLSAQDIANQMQTGQFNAGLLQQARGANQAAGNQALQFGAGNRMTANLANQAAANQARQFGAASGQTADLANQTASNLSRQFGATAQNQRDMERAGLALQRGQGLSGLSMGAQGLGQGLFGIGQQINQDQMGAGGLQQQLMQQILSGAQGQYGQFMGMPQNLLNMQLAALGMNPLTTATTTTGQYKPGLMDFLGLGMQGLGAWRMGA